VRPPPRLFGEAGEPAGSTVLGIDFSSFAVDIVALVDDEREAIALPQIQLDGPRAIDRARRVPEISPSELAAWGVWLVAIEEPYSQNRGTVRALSRVQGAILARLPLWLRVVETPPTEWLAVFSGLETVPARTSERKALAKDKAVERVGYPATFWTHDQADAYGIGWAVRELNSRGIDAAERRERP
jgi:hypothetical protein